MDVSAVKFQTEPVFIRNKPVFGRTYVPLSCQKGGVDEYIRKQKGIIRYKTNAAPIKQKEPGTKRYTLKDYNKLTPEGKDNIYATVPDKIKTAASINAYMGVIFKHQLDEKFGENRYKFISIGTSPACVARAMELMGADVIYLPMSFSKGTCAKSWLDKSPYIDFYKQYMKEKGLTNEDLIKENKTAVISDYVSTGRSLQLSEYMLTGPLGLKQPLVETITMNDIIKNSDAIDNDAKNGYLNNFLRAEKTADYTSVPHFSFLDKTPLLKGEITDYKSFKNKLDSNAGAVSNAHDFCLMKVLEEAKLLKRE